MSKSPTPLRIAIAATGRNHTEVAEASGVERTRFSRIVNGLHADEATQQAIADALGRTVDELWPAQAAEVAA